MAELTRPLILLRMWRDGVSAAMLALSVHPMMRNHKNKTEVGGSVFRSPRCQATWLLAAWFSLCLFVLAPASVWARASRYPEQATQPAVNDAPSSVEATRVALSALPPQAQFVYQRILAGGPFRYEKDGVTFGNRERLLPRQPRGFYREYTVPTPGERDRGARRIVCGGKKTQTPETCFYSGDHYASFLTIDPRH